MAIVKHLLAIGINSYEGTFFEALDNPARDAQTVARILEDIYGFDSPVLLLDKDATRNKIVQALIDLSEKCSTEDLVIIYYAGHGGIHPTSNDTCWIPIDGEKERPNHLYDSEIEGRIAQIAAKHIFVISDSCYSGQMFKKISSPVTFSDIKDVESRNSRWLFASGRATVPDGQKGSGSPFCGSLCEYLENNKYQPFSVNQLCEHVANQVKSERSSQTAIWKPIGTVNGEHGQMIFRSIDGSINKEYNAMNPKPVFDLPDVDLQAEYIPRTFTLNGEPMRGKISFRETTDKNLTLKELVSIHKRLVILGTAGSGKTVELRTLAKELQENSPLVPYYERLNHYTNEDLANFLPAKVLQVPSSRLVLLLDGLDEIQTEYFPTALKKITSFAEAKPDTTIVIACRTNFFDLPENGVNIALSNFKVINLDDLSNNKIASFCYNQYGFDGTSFLQEAYETGLLNHIQKPFFLYTAVKYFRKFNNLRKNRSSLMEETLDDYYTENKNHFAGTGKLLSRSLAFQMLEKIGFVMEVMGRNYISDVELSKLFPDQVQYSNCQYLPAFRRDLNKEQWMFEHNNIQEYLAARVLQKEPFEKMLSHITYSIDGHKRIRPTWVNTLSFLISLAEDIVINPLIEWILNNDPEVLVRFEVDRINEVTRIAGFKKIFEYYDTRQIWINSNKFSDKELAVFGNLDDCIDYLITLLESTTTTRMTKLNVIHVLDNYDLNQYPGRVPQIEKALLAILDEIEAKEPDPYGVQSILKAFAELHITSNDLVNNLTARYRKRLNQHVRAGLYKLLHSSDVLHEHIDVLVEGMNLVSIEGATKDRDEVSLLDESFHLSEALEKISRPKEIGIIFDFLGSEKYNHSLYNDDFREVVESLVKNAIQLYPTEPVIFETVLSYFKNSVLHYSSNTKSLIYPFFQKTGTEYLAFARLWKETADDKFWQRAEYIDAFISMALIDQIVADIPTGIFETNDLAKIYDAILFNRQGNPLYEFILDKIEAIAKSQGIILTVRQSLQDRSVLDRKRNQEAFDILFDTKALENEIRSIYDNTGKTSIQREELHRLRTSNLRLVDDAYNLSAIEIIRDLTNQTDNSVSLDDIDFLFHNSEEITKTILQKVYHYLKDGRIQNITITEEQKEIIRLWSETLPLSPSYLWAFIKVSKPNLQENKILNLTTFYDYNTHAKVSDPGIIDELEHYVSKPLLKTRVIENLQNHTNDPIAWTGNASYALRKSITESFETIIDHLTKGRIRDYKLHELLKFWFNTTEDSKRVTKFILETSNEYLRWYGVELLVEYKKERNFLITYLVATMTDEETKEEFRLKAANHLVALQDIRGFIFQAEFVLSNPHPNLEFDSIFRNAHLLTDPSALDLLMELLYLSIQPAYRSNRFNSIGRPLYSALYNIGVQSEANYIQVKTALQSFIQTHQKEYPNIHFLEYHIKTIEEKLAMIKTTSLTISEAINEFEKTSL